MTVVLFVPLCCVSSPLCLCTPSDLSDLELPAPPAGESDRRDPDAVNRELYRLLLETVAALHQRQVTLSDRDCRQIPQLIGERERPDKRPHPPFMAGEERPRGRYTTTEVALLPRYGVACKS